MKHVTLVLLFLVYGITGYAQSASEVFTLRRFRVGMAHIGVIAATNTVYFNSHRQGLYTLDTNTLAITPIAGTIDFGAEYGDGFSVGAFRSLLLAQHGQMNAAQIIDSSGIITKFNEVFWSGAVLSDYLGRITMTDGKSWFQAQFGPITTPSAPFGIQLVVDSSSLTYYANHRSSPTGHIRTAIPRLTKLNAPANLYFTAFAEDSIMWFTRTAGKSDSICRAKLGELHCSCDTLLAGRTSAVLFLQEDDRGRVIHIDTSGNYAVYADGEWTWQPFRLPLVESDRKLNGLMHRGAKDLIFVKLGQSRYSSHSRQSVSIRIPFNSLGLPEIDSINARESGPWYTTGGEGIYSPLNWVRPNGEIISMNSIVRTIENYPSVSVLSGVMGSRPLAISFADDLLKPAHDGLAQFVESNISNYFYSWRDNDRGSPILLDVSRRGIMQPYRTGNCILFPGSQISVHDTNGNFIRILDKRSSTTIITTRTSDTIMGTEDAQLVVRRSSGQRDSIDLSSTLSSDIVLDSAGFVSHLFAIDDSTWLAAVSARLMVDTATFLPVPFEAGGIGRSTDAGHSWQTISLPVAEKYVISAMSTTSGALLLTLTECVVDTSIHEIRDQVTTSESQTTTMSNRVIVRSTDRGVTWAQVHRSECGVAMRMVGGYGVQADNGMLLMPVADNLMQSTDDGHTWDYHEAVDRENPVISLFKGTGPGPVYYCTEGGLFKNDLATNVNIDNIDGLDSRLGVSADPTDLRASSSIVVHITNADRTRDRVSTLLIVDVLGNTIVDLKHYLDYTNPQQDISVDCSSWSRGVYYLVVRDDQTSSTLSLVKVE